MVSQLVFGERVQGLEQQGNWLKIRNESDAYEGWATSYMLTSVSGSQANGTPFYRFISSNEPVLFDESGRSMHLPIGAVIPSAEPYMSKDHLQIGERRWRIYQDALFLSINPSELLSFAQRLLYTPYLWGGRSSYGIDCSGFTQLCYKVCGIAIPRDSGQQWKAAKQISWASRKPTDLVFFNQNGKPNISHVGILMNANEIIHASGRVRIDSIQAEGIIRKSDQKLTHQFVGIGRFI